MFAHYATAKPRTESVTVCFRDDKNRDEILAEVWKAVVDNKDVAVFKATSIRLLLHLREIINNTLCNLIDNRCCSCGRRASGSNFLYFIIEIEETTVNIIPIVDSGELTILNLISSR